MPTRFSSRHWWSKSGSACWPIAGADGVELNQRSRTGSGQFTSWGRWYQAHPFRRRGGIGIGDQHVLQHDLGALTVAPAECGRQASWCLGWWSAPPAPSPNPGRDRPWGFRLNHRIGVFEAKPDALTTHGAGWMPTSPNYPLWPVCASNRSRHRHRLSNRTGLLASSAERRSHHGCWGCR